MRHGRYERRAPAAKHGRHAKKRKLNKSFLVTLSILLILGMVVGGTVAYLIVNGGQVTNTFTPGYVACSVDANGKITNEGNVDAYIRAAVVVNWVDGSGNVYAVAPDCRVTPNEAGGWIAYTDGYFYYVNSGNAAVSPGASNAIPKPAIVTGGDNNTDANIYHLEIDVVAEAIQAEGEKDSDGTLAFADAWGITIPNIGG